MCSFSFPISWGPCVNCLRLFFWLFLFSFSLVSVPSRFPFSLILTPCCTVLSDPSTSRGRLVARSQDRDAPHQGKRKFSFTSSSIFGVLLLSPPQTFSSSIFLVNLTFPLPPPVALPFPASVLRVAALPSRVLSSRSRCLVPGPRSQVSGPSSAHPTLL